MDMFTLYAIIVLTTSIWVAFDSHSNKIPMDRKKYSLNNGAIVWFISCVLLWIITFPYYLSKRSKVLRGDTESSEDIEKANKKSNLYTIILVVIGIAVIVAVFLLMKEISSI